MNARVVLVLLMGFLMVSLVVGAGYNIVVPTAGGVVANTPSGGTVGTTPADNQTDNGTTDDVETTDGTVDDNEVGEDDEEVSGFVGKMGWKSISIVLLSLLVVGGVVWYFLKNKRNGFVEVRARK